MRETTLVAVLFGAALLMAGCTSKVGGVASAADDRPATTTTSTSTTPAAADGTDVSACVDADCEILATGVTQLPIGPQFGCSTFVVTFVAPNRVEFMVQRLELNPVNAYIMGDGYVGLANGVKVAVTQLDGTGVILRITPETMDPANDLTSGSEGAGSFG